MNFESTRPTHAARPFYVPPPAYIATALLIRWYDMCHAIASTSADYDVPVLPVGTQAQPVGALQVDERQVQGSAVYELRRLSGLTWDELAEMLGVTRQAANDWANGRPMKPANAHKLHALVAGFRSLPATSAAEARAALLAATPGGSGRALDLLRAGHIDEGLAVLAAYRSGKRVAVPPREPHREHPAEYLGRIADRPTPATGPVAAKRTRRARVNTT